ALEDFRLISNLERHGRKAAQIVLAGQYELARHLADPAMRSFNERIGARAVLLPLTALECRQYIEHRLRRSGTTSDRIFARRALTRIVRHGAGVPRRITALCHNSLLLAYSGGVKRVTPAMARAAAAEDTELGEARKHDKGLGWLLPPASRGSRLMSPVGL